MWAVNEGDKYVGANPGRVPDGCYVELFQDGWSSHLGFYNLLSSIFPLTSVWWCWAEKILKGRFSDWSCSLLRVAIRGACVGMGRVGEAVFLPHLLTEQMEPSQRSWASTQSGWTITHKPHCHHSFHGSERCTWPPGLGWTQEGRIWHPACVLSSFLQVHPPCYSGFQPPLHSIFLVCS